MPKENTKITEIEELHSLVAHSAYTQKTTETQLDNFIRTHKESIVDRVIFYDGNLSSAARSLGIKRSVLQGIINNDPVLTDLVNDLDLSLIDFAEETTNQIIRKIDVANPSRQQTDLLKFVMNTKAKDRGYTTRTEVKTEVTGKVNIIIAPEQNVERE